MAKRRTHQEWQTLLAQYESSHLTQRVFCEQHGLSLSTFYAKRQQLQRTGRPHMSGFVKAEVAEKMTRNPVAQTPVAQMTLLINNVELTLPQSMPVTYLAALIGALS